MTDRRDPPIPYPPIRLTVRLDRKGRPVVVDPDHGEPYGAKYEWRNGDWLYYRVKARREGEP